MISLRVLMTGIPTLAKMNKISEQAHKDALKAFKHAAAEGMDAIAIRQAHHIRTGMSIAAIGRQIRNLGELAQANATTELAKRNRKIISRTGATDLDGTYHDDLRQGIQQGQRWAYQGTASVKEVSRGVFTFEFHPAIYQHDKWETEWKTLSAGYRVYETSAKKNIGKAVENAFAQFFLYINKNTINPEQEIKIKRGRG